ncbi:MAG: glycosyltransferase involved in cell wall biosynthesis [Arenicella sp.]|jgi:glycosyltransferase involved in cell wall biosynthesis
MKTANSPLTQLQETSDWSDYCVLVPHYNHVAELALFLPKLERLNLACIVVDDGSEPTTKLELKSLISPLQGFHLIEHAKNRGKGAAIETGSRHARQLAFTHMLQIDADGQHDLADVPKFLHYSRAHPKQIVSGAPSFDASAPKARVYGRKVTDFWVALETLSLGVKDSLCGFRVYPLAEFERVYQKHSIGARMEFDTDVLVKSIWQGIQIHFIPTKVIYFENSVSHFHYLRDNLRLIYLHVGLMIGMLIRLPKLLYWRLIGRQATSN